MAHESPLIGILVFGLGLAFVFGTIANRLKLSPLVGYLLAGVVIGPFTPGFVADSALTLELADVGVILLMFGVGLHFSPKDLMAVRRIAIPGAVLQVAVAASLGALVAAWLGWPLASGMVFGLALSIASTVVMMRALQERRLMDTDRGRIAVGWLVVQDLLTVLALVLLPPLAGVMKGGALDAAALAVSLALTFGKLALFAALMFVVGKRAIPWILHYIAHTGSRELFRLAVLAIALGVAYGAATLFGVSFALGAFFAGMILSESPLSQRAAEESLPLRDAFAVLFFVSVGMVFDPLTVVHEPLALLATLAVVLIGSAGSAFLIVRLFGYPLGDRADARRGPGADRRVLLHPRRSRHRSEADARTRARSHPRHVDPHHLPQSVPMEHRRAPAQTRRAATEAEEQDAGTDTDDADWPCGARRLRPRRQADRRRYSEGWLAAAGDRGRRRRSRGAARRRRRMHPGQCRERPGSGRRQCRRRAHPVRRHSRRFRGRPDRRAGAPRAAGPGDRRARPFRRPSTPPPILYYGGARFPLLFFSFAAGTASRGVTVCATLEGELWVARMITIRILGLDPGLAHMGWGVIDVAGSRLTHVAHGVIATKPAAEGLGLRLMMLHRELALIIAEHAPAAIAVEQAFVHKDPSAALKLGHARAVALLAAAQAGLEIAEYAPNHIKKCVVGVGHAGKEQVQAMVRLLPPPCRVEQADAADALACAIAHAHLSTTRARIAAALA